MPLTIALRPIGDTLTRINVINQHSEVHSEVLKRRLVVVVQET
jgi:hypothetical protein